MGYSASVACRSRKAQAEMLAFLDAHYRDAVDAGIGKYRRHEAYGPSSGLKYSRGACGIGFNSPHDYENALLQWMALRVGKRRVFRSDGIHQAVPWLNCDDQRSQPVLLRSEWPDATERQEQWLVDEHGFAPHPRYWREDDPERARLDAYYAEQDRHIEAELRRLSELWSAR